MRSRGGEHMAHWIFLTWIWVPSGWGPVPLSKSVMGPYPTVAVCEAARSEILSVADDDWRVYVGQCREKERLSGPSRFGRSWAGAVPGERTATGGRFRRVRAGRALAGEASR